MVPLISMAASNPVCYFFVATFYLPYSDDGVLVVCLCWWLALKVVSFLLWIWVVVVCVSNGGLVDSGDRLISVNEKSLEGLSHTTVVDILQNSPDDVTLVVSQPKERLYKGKIRVTGIILVFMCTLSGLILTFIQNLFCSNRISWRIFTLPARVFI